MGHEASGIVHAAGAAVTTLQAGDHVAIEPGIPCRRCKACKDGTYNLCADVRFAAAPPYSHGALAKFFLVPEDFLYRVDAHVSLQEAVLIEPLAVAVHANRTVGVKPGGSVLVMGSGTIGLLCGAVAAAFGARRVMLVDISEAKLAFASEYLHCETYLSDPACSPEESALGVREKLGVPHGYDTVIEASGAEASMQTGIYALRLGGAYIQTGIGKPMANMPMLALSEKELRVFGCFRYRSGDYELATQLVADGKVRLGPLVSSVTEFEYATQAWDRTARGEGVKNLIEGARD